MTSIIYDEWYIGTRIYIEGGLIEEGLVERVDITDVIMSGDDRLIEQ
jgi:hypothetical protein